jgi:short-subunit dehydrogenase
VGRATIASTLLGLREADEVRRLSRGGGVLEPADVPGEALRMLGQQSTVVVGFANKMKAFSPRLLPRRAATRVFGRFVTTVG